MFLFMSREGAMYEALKYLPSPRELAYRYRSGGDRLLKWSAPRHVRGSRCLFLVVLTGCVDYVDGEISM